mmetsp:Transcript_95193/g.226640  ORF Transcript_95193/g.226640 Transcript_95193/m.226640 type:complete len:221 (-) Transcript_95193:141-803(-)
MAAMHDGVCKWNSDLRLGNLSLDRLDDIHHPILEDTAPIRLVAHSNVQASSEVICDSAEPVHVNKSQLLVANSHHQLFDRIAALIWPAGLPDKLLHNGTIGGGQIVGLDTLDRLCQAQVLLDPRNGGDCLTYLKRILHPLHGKVDAHLAGCWLRLHRIRDGKALWVLLLHPGAALGVDAHNAPGFRLKELRRLSRPCISQDGASLGADLTVNGFTAGPKY